MKGIVSIIVSLILMCGTPCESIEGTCGGIFIDYPPEPPSAVPRPHSVPDPASYKPMQILFIPLHATPIDQENMLLFQEAFDYANEKLGKMLKTTRLKEIRLTRVFNTTTGKCDPPECSETKIPGQYVLPCKDSSGQLVPEKTVSEEDRVKQYNNGQYSVVIYIELDSFGTGTRCYKGSIAFASNCRRGDFRRPTHGRISFCDRPKQMKRETFLTTVVHETLHILLTKLDGRYIDIGQEENKYGELDAVENITWKRVTRNWPLKAGSRETTLHIPMTITPNVLEFVRNHFDCPQVEGAELELGLKNNRVKHLAGHWSLRLFSEDILAAISTSTERITNLTLAFAKDTKWYEVDMSYADPMDVSKPPERGCDVATESCHRFLDINEDNVQMFRPFCDRKMRAVTPLCSPDGVWRLECDHFSDSTLNCDIAYGAAYPQLGASLHTPINHPKCSHATFQPDVAGRYGLKVGPGTMCITFIDPPWTRNRPLMPACVDFECLKDSLVLKFQNKYGQCNIPLKAGEFDNKLANFTFKKGSECRKLFSKLDIIGPDVNVVCSAQSTAIKATTDTTTGAGMSTNKKDTTTMTSTSTTTSRSGSVSTKNWHTTWFMLVILGFIYLN